MLETAFIVPLLALQVATIENSEARRGPVQGDPDEIGCVRAMPTGTRVRPSRICRTRVEWAQIRDDNYRLVNEKTAALPFPRE